jgi:hypothetical protein
MTAVADRPCLTFSQLDEYRERGFVVVRRAFTAREMAALSEEADRLLHERRDLIDPLNLRCRYMPHAETQEPLFEVFDPVNDISPLCTLFTADERITERVACLYGEPACLFKDKLIFKPPGAMGYNLHQDIPLAWKGFPRTFLTVLIPIDACDARNGATEVFAGYHRDGHLETEAGNPYKVPDSSVDSQRGVLLDLAPGDIAIFHGLTPHRSAPNRSDRPRRTLYVSYNALSDGGDQRAAHYAEFHEMLRNRREPAEREKLYFR